MAAADTPALPTTATVPIPHLDDHEPYRVARTRLDELRQELIALDAESNRLAPLARSVSSLDVKATKYINGDRDAGSAGVARQKYEELVVRRRTLARAIELQDRAVTQIERVAQVELSKRLLPEYRRRMAQVLTDLTVAAESVHAMNQWLRDVTDEGVRSLGVLPPVVPEVLLGDPREWNGGRLHFLVKEAVEAGLIGYDHPAALACGITPPKPAPAAVPAPAIAAAPKPAGPRAAESTDMTEYRKLRARRPPAGPAAAAAVGGV